MENRCPYWKVCLRLLFSILATVLFVVAVIALIRFFMPFVIGWIIAAIAAPLVNLLEKKLKIVRKLGSALIVILVLAAVIGVLYLGISRIVSEISDLVKNFPQIYAQLENGFGQAGNTLSGIFDRLPDGIQNGWDRVTSNLDQYMGRLVSGGGEPTVMAAGNLAKRVPSYLLSFLVTVLSAYFFIVQREEVLGWIKRTAPESVRKRMTLVTDNLKYAVGGYFKAQFKIMAVIFLLLLVGLGFLGTGYFVLVALLIAFLDFLPFFGTGTVLIPWAVYSFFMGNYKLTVALLILYVITLVVHQLLQPKLVGDSVGLNPLVTLILLYIGYRIGGVLWMILAVPIGMVLINMCRAGAFDYIFDDVRILARGILELRDGKRK